MNTNQDDTEITPYLNQDGEMCFQENDYPFNDQTTENFSAPIDRYNKIIEQENMHTTSSTKSSSKGYHQKNCPKLFGKQLNSMARSNIHFNNKKEMLLKDPEKIKQFNTWLDNNVLNRLKNLKDFQNIWTIKEEDQDKEFKETFKELSVMFFSKFSMRYIANSKIKNKEQKKLFVKLIPKYLRGIKNPESFNYMIKGKK